MTCRIQYTTAMNDSIPLPKQQQNYELGFAVESQPHPVYYRLCFQRISHMLHCHFSPPTSLTCECFLNPHSTVFLSMVKHIFFFCYKASHFPLKSESRGYIHTLLTVKCTEAEMIGVIFMKIDLCTYNRITESVFM